MKGDHPLSMNHLRKLSVLAGTIGPLLFGSVLLALTIVEYDFMRSLGWEVFSLTNTDWPSGLALGPYGYVMTAAFLVNGLMVVLFAIGLVQTLPATTTSRAATSLLLLAGLAMIGLASTTDPTIRTTPATLHGRIHDLSFAAVGLTLFPSMLLFGWVFRQLPGWRSLSTYTWLTVALAVPTFALKGATFYAFLVAVLVWAATVALRSKKMDLPG
jgi:hypothetical protein